MCKLCILLQNAVLCVLFGMALLAGAVSNAVYAADNQDLYNTGSCGGYYSYREVCEDLEVVYHAEAAAAVSSRTCTMQLVSFCMLTVYSPLTVIFSDLLHIVSKNPFHKVTHSYCMYNSRNCTKIKTHTVCQRPRKLCLSEPPTPFQPKKTIGAISTKFIYGTLHKNVCELVAIHSRAFVKGVKLRSGLRTSLRANGEYFVRHSFDSKLHRWLGYIPVIFCVWLS